MKRLTIIGRVATPAAMVVFMTYEISRSMAVTGGWLVAIVIGAALTAVGIEVVGILSGHALETSWRVGDQWRALLAFVLLLIYTVGAVYILRRNDTIMPVPIIAAIVYVVAALVDGLERHVAHEETAVSQRESHELEQDRLDREAKRQREAEAEARKHEGNLRKMELDAQSAAIKEEQEAARILARAEARALKNSVKVPRKVSESDSETFTHWRTIPDDVKRKFASMSAEEIHEENPEVTFRTAQNWHENAQKLTSKVSSNGVSK